jgi:acyl carrier protein
MEFAMTSDNRVIDELIGRLIGLVETSTSGRTVVSRDDLGPESLRRLGLDSLGTLTFLVAVEDEFGIEWPDDLPKDILASFEAMAAYIASELGLAA